MTFNFIAQKREKKVEDVRIQGLLPGVLYGPEIEPVSLEVEYNKFAKLYEEAGESSLIDFTVGESKEPVKVLIQDIQYDPVKGKMIHFDLRQIKMGEEMTVNIMLNFVGEAPSVKEQSGTLVKNLVEVEAKCLPKDLVSEIDVDLTSLSSFEDIIRIKDLKLPDGIKIIGEVETVVVKVIPPLTVEQLRAMDEAEAPKVEDVKVDGEQKEGEEETKGEQKEEEKKDEKEKK